MAPLLLAVGALAAAQKVSLSLALGLIIGASLLADVLWYAIGRRRGGQALGVLCRVTLEPDSCVRRAHDLFLKHGCARSCWESSCQESTRLWRASRV